MTLSQGTTIRWIGKREFDAKLLAAVPNILAENRAMAKEMLEAVKADIEPGTPLGPGHFGVHLRDSYNVVVQSSYGGINYRTVGRLKVPVQGYRREFGTRGRYRGRTARLKAQASVRLLVGETTAGVGEKAGLFATKALRRVRGMIRLFYGRQQWWRL